jgi:hypothetical protein
MLFSIQKGQGVAQMPCTCCHKKESSAHERPVAAQFLGRALAALRSIGMTNRHVDGHVAKLSSRLFLRDVDCKNPVIKASSMQCLSGLKYNTVLPFLIDQKCKIRIFAKKVKSVFTRRSPRKNDEIYISERRLLKKEINKKPMLLPLSYIMSSARDTQMVDFSCPFILQQL